MSDKTSDFESRIALKKQRERKERQQELFERIGDYPLGIMPFRVVFQLFRFFEMEDPSDQDLLVATQLVRARTGEAHDFMERIRDTLQKPPDTA